MTWAQQVRDALLKQDKSLTQVANATGLNPGVLAKFSRGESDLQVKSFEKLAQHLGYELVDMSRATTW